MARPTPEALAKALARLESLLASHGDSIDGDALGTVREAIELPELMGRTDAARTLATTTSNLHKIAGLPEPVYKLRAGAFYDADAIRDLARQRREANGDHAPARR